MGIGFMLDGRVTFGLLVFGLMLVYSSTVTIANAQQPSFPSISDMSVNSGKYSDPNSGLDITFPDGWHGYKISPDNGTGVMMLKDGGKLTSAITLAIFDKSKITKIPVGQPTGSAFKNIKCDITSTSTITQNGMNGINVIEQCSGDSSLKYKMTFFQTDKYLIDLMLGGEPAEFEKDLAVYSATLGTLTIQNTTEAPSVPEFSSLAGMIITISIICVIVFSRFKFHS